MPAKSARRKPQSVGNCPTISVCMIVRNEAHNLAACLAPLRDWAHEIIVVDTGSTDRTAEIAAALGATVYHFTWIDDFAAARNESIRHASGGWIFWLDADDRVDRAAQTKLAQAAAWGQADAFICSIRSRLADGTDEVTEHIRLFRNHAGIGFYGRVHETVLPSIVAKGLKYAHLSVTITHTGYAEGATVEVKAARNLAIVEAALANDPNNLDLLFYRCQSLYSLNRKGDIRGDLEAFLKGTRATRRQMTQRIWAYGMLLSIADHSNDRVAFERTLTEALIDFPDQPYFLALRAKLDVNVGNVKLALQRVDEAVANRTRASGTAPSPAWLAQVRSECCLGALDFAGARRSAREALQHDPTSIMAQCLLITADILEGRFAEAEEALAPLLGASKIEPWITLYDLRLRQGRCQAAADAIDEAVARGLDEGRAGHFRKRLKAAELDTSYRQGGSLQRGLDFLACSNFYAAAESFGAAIEAAPTEPQAYRYLAVVLQKLGAEDQAVEAWQLAQHWERAAQLAA